MAGSQSQEMNLVEARTDWFEDRTMLADERTFAGWMRTGLASISIGVGFQALFRAFEPTWVAKSVASLFLLIAVFIFAIAYLAAARLRRRLDIHDAEPASRQRMPAIAIGSSVGALVLIPVIWLLKG